LHAYALDPKTGKVLGKRVVNTPHDIPVNTGSNQLVYTGAKSDLLVAGDNGVYLQRILLFPKKSRPVDPDDRPIRTTGGFLEDTWFNREHWYMGNERFTQYMIGDDTRAFAVRVYKHDHADMGYFTPGAEGYMVYCADTANRPPRVSPGMTQSAAPKAVGRVSMVGRPRTAGRPRLDKPSPRRWQIRVPIRVTAMARAGNTLFLAGAPDVAAEGSDPYATYRGERAGVLRAVSVKDGTTLSECKLPSGPVYDGLAAARGRLYVSTVKGHVFCFGSAADTGDTIR
jgi:hypothetical protein